MSEEKTMENPDEMSMAKAIKMIEELKFKFKVDPSFRITNKSIKDIRVGDAKYRHDSINCGVHVTRAMVKSFFIVLNSDVINDKKLEGNIKKKIKTLNALFGHKELRVVTLFNKDYQVELSLPFKYRNDIYANKYMHTGVDKDGNIYIYVGKDFDDDPICNGYRKYMKSDKSKKLCYEKLTKKDVNKSFKKAEARKDNVVLSTKPGPDVFVFNDVEKKLDRYKKLAVESGVPIVTAVQEYAPPQKDLDTALEDRSQKIGVCKDVEKFVND